MTFYIGSLYSCIVQSKLYPYRLLVKIPRDIGRPVYVYVLLNCYCLVVTILFSGLISHTALLAEKVSAKVKVLDLAKSRVAECQQRVHDLIDLR